MTAEAFEGMLLLIWLAAYSTLVCIAFVALLIVAALEKLK